MNWPSSPRPRPGGPRECFPTSTRRSGCSPVGRDRALCRLDRPDPVAAWETHLDALAARRDFLNRKQYDALSYTGPGTELTIGLPAGHLWVSGQLDQPRRHSVRAEPADRRGVHDAAQGSRGRHRAIDQAAQLRRHADRGLHACGSRTAGSWTSRPTRGETVLRSSSTPTPARPGSASSRSCRTARRFRSPGLLFYNTLFDENAASHVALGSAYRFTLRGGEDDDDEAVRGRRRQPQRASRRLHDRIRRARRRRRPPRAGRSSP